MSNENLTLFVNKTSDKLINELRRPSCLLHSLVQLKTPTLLGEVEGLLHLGVRGHRAPSPTPTRHLIGQIFTSH